MGRTPADGPTPLPPRPVVRSPARVAVIRTSGGTIPPPSQQSDRTRADGPHPRIAPTPAGGLAPAGQLSKAQVDAAALLACG